MIRIIRSSDEFDQDVPSLNKHRLAMTVGDLNDGEIAALDNTEWTWREFTQALSFEKIRVSDAGTLSSDIDDRTTSAFWFPGEYKVDANDRWRLGGVSCAVLDLIGLSSEQRQDILSMRVGFGWLAWIMYGLPIKSAKTMDVRIVFPFSDMVEPDEASEASRFLLHQLVYYESPIFRSVCESSFDMARTFCWPVVPEGQEYWSVVNYGAPLFVDTMIDNCLK